MHAFGCVDGTHIPIKCPSDNSQDYFCLYSSIQLMYRLCVTTKGYSWMLSVDGLEVCMIAKYLQIRLSVEN